MLAQILSSATGRPYAISSDIATSDFSVILPSASPLELSEDEAKTFGLSVLSAAGLSVIDEGNISRIVRNPHGSSIAIGATQSQETFGLITRVFALKNIAAQEVKEILDSANNQKTTATVLENSNYLVVTDTSSAINRLQDLINELDKPGLTRKIEVVKLTNADAESLAAQLNSVAAQSLQSEGAALAQRLSSGNGAVVPPALLRAGIAVPAPRSGSLILVGQETQIEEFKALIKELDIDVPSGRGTLNFIELEYLNAQETAKTLTQLLEKTASKSRDTQDLRRISVEASQVNNALIVDASPQDFELVKSLVSSLDKVPGQVHVSLLIAEVTSGSGFTWDPRFTILDVSGKQGDTAVGGGSRLTSDTSSLVQGAASGVLPQGLTAAISHDAVSFDSNGNLLSGSFPGIISIEALKSDDRVKIVSETSLQAQNNIEAEVKVVDEIPLATSNIQGTGADRETVQTVERKDVGITFKFTPYIVPGGNVRMMLEPEISSVRSTTQDHLNPTIAKRSAKTTVTVPNGQTIVIAGLTRTTTSKVEHRIPILGYIPILGWLFRYVSDVEEQTDLLIFVTPTIITSPENAQETTLKWQTKTGLTSQTQEEEPQPQND